MERQIALEELAIVLEVPLAAIDETKSFIGSGGHSITALQFTARCMERQVSVGLDSVLRKQTIKELLDSCERSEPQSSRVSGYKQSTSHDITPPFQDNPKGGQIPQLDDRIELAYDLSDSVSSDLTAPSSSYNEPLTANTTPASELLPTTTGIDLRAVHNEVEDLCDPQHVPDILGKLTEIQLSLIHGSIQKPGTNIIHYYETYHTTQLARIKSAWKQVLRNEKVFCTPYRNPEDGCYLIPKIHWREFETNSRQAYEKVIQGDDNLAIWPDTANEPIDLSNRFTVVTFCDEVRQHKTSVVIWSIHHALIDGWSASNVLNKVRQAASGFPIKPGNSFLDLVTSLEDLQKSLKTEGDCFWQAQQGAIAEARDKFLLPPPPQAAEPDAGRTSAEITLSMERYWDAISQAARSCEVTTVALLHAAWAITLAAYTDSENVVFGAVVSGRSLPLPGVFDAIGPMLNTLPLQVSFSQKSSVRAFLVDVFNKLQNLNRFAWTAPDNGFSRAYESIFAMQLEPGVDHLNPGIVKPTRPSFSTQRTNIPVSIVLNGRGDVKLQFSTDQYLRSHMHGVAKCFRDAVVSLTHLDMSLEACMSGLTSTESLATLRHLGNCESGWTTRSCSSDDLVTLFEASSSRHPESIAVETPNRKLTYSELNRLSGVLAREISSVISPQQVVPVHADGSVNWIIAIWAVLRAGGTYCPIDHHHPQAVRDSIFASCEAKYFLATSNNALENKCPEGVTAIDVASVLAVEANEQKDKEAVFPARHSPRPWENAYVCFTSGSTGKPKGVVCTHEGLVAFQRDLEVRLFAEPGRRVAQVMSAAFDGSIHEIFSCLCYGATLILRNKEEPLSHLKSADSAILTPSIASHMDPADYPLLKTVYLVGEAVPQLVCDRWASSKTVYNMYGPTEATCGATIARLLPRRPVTIGKPNPSTRVYILNQHRQLAPVGRIGEIWLAGVQVARGYIGQPELTQERFFVDSICKGLGESMYRTGDHGYWNQDGEIVFLGRADRLVKLRGFRLDLDDLEMRIMQCCSDARAVAVACRDKNDLVCMVQTSDWDVTRLRTKIAAALPVYAVPRYILPVDKFPMTAAGKIDYKAVAAISAQDMSLKIEDELQTATEKKVAAVWADVLDLDSSNELIKPSSSFIDLGGHSLRQLRLVSMLKSEFSVSINLRMVLELPTLRHLAQEIDSLQQQQSPSAPPETCHELHRHRPSPAEQHWWHRYTWEHGLASFNVSFVCKYDSKLVDQRKLVQAWDHVLSRYELLRSRYVHDRKRGLERVLTSQAPKAQRLDSIDVWLELNTPFALDTSPPVRVHISRDTIVAVWSHIVCDYTTLSLLLAEVGMVYRSETLPLDFQKYHETTAWNSFSPDCSMTFWEKYLHGVPHTQPAYLGKKTARSSYRGTSSTARVSSLLWHRVRAYMDESRVTGQQLALAAAAVALSSADEAMDVTLGIPFLNRRTEADMRTVGLFLEPLPVRIAFRQDADADAGDPDGLFPAAPATCREYIAVTQSLSQRALANAMPWARLLEHLGVRGEAVLPDHPLFDCVVSFHDMRPAVSSTGGAWDQLDLGVAAVEPQLVWSEGSKFKLMVEFMALSDDSLVMRLEYDDTCYEGADHIAAVRRLILRALDAITDAADNSSHDDSQSKSPGSFRNTRKQIMQTWMAEEATAFAPVDRAGDFVDDIGSLFRRPLGDI